MRKKSQRILSLFLSLVTVVQLVGVVPAAAADSSLSGAGTAENPYQISSEDDLALMTEQLNGTDAADFVNAYYQVTQDIELKEEVTPIATFSGVLDGDGHTISGLTVGSKTDRAALISVNNGTISNLGMTHVSISGTPSSGNVKRAAFAIENRGTIENCYATGSLSGGWRVGGIATENYGTVENCYFVGSVSGNWETGGIAAWCADASNSITNCYAKVTGSATTSSVGAITGYAYASTTLKGNVALDGALTSKGSISRICGKEKSTPITYQNNLSCEDLLINGSKITDGTADNKNGLNKTAAELTQQETYAAIGWDFEDVWTMDETLGRPTLRSCPESADAVEYPMPEGSGTEESPYCIADEEDLKLVIAAINSGAGDYAEAYYQLTDDITVNGAIPSVFAFSGVFDGNGHSIDGYELSTSDETDALFRKNTGTIRCLALTDVKVTGPGTPETSRRASLCFQNYGTIEECFVTGNVSGGHRAGGIVAENYKTIQNCYFKGDVVGGCETGGITAWNQTTGIVKNCYVSGSITTLSNNSGLIGGYGYTGTVYQGNVVLSGSSLTSANDKNYARICGRNNSDTTFIDNLACDDVLVQGNLVQDGTADNLNGLDKTAEELTQAVTYTSIGWDFEQVWVMDDELGRPALRSCREKAPEVDVEQPDKQIFTVSSPDQNLVATIYVTADDELGYSVRLNESDVLLRASLGLTVDGVDMGQNITLDAPVETSFDETYTTRGMHTTARNHYNQSAFVVTHKDDNKTITLNFRAYNDGIAIQYVMPDGSVTISGDDTRFALPTNAKAFFQYGDNADGSESYEGIRNMQGVTTTSTVAGIGKGRLLCTLPTFQLADKAAYVCITEANIYDWSGMGLRAEGDGVLKVEYWDANGKTFTTEEDSPWRVAIIADNLTDFVNSDMVTNVSEPEDERLFTDKSYIQPGRSVWTTQGGGASTVEGYKEYSKYASQLGIEFNLIEARTGFGDTLEQQFAAIKEIADYSAELENPVKIWLWEDAPTGRYPGGLYVEENARAFLQSCKDAGVVGVKIDHIHSEAPDKVSFYEDFNKLAAEYNIMVSYHNPSKPSGLSRTYPNEMTREAIRGLQYKTDPNENAILPFTRLLAGGADYTPLNFTNGSKLGSASWVHMLANTVIMTSPYLQFSENPKNMVGQVYTDFIKVVPSVWDETIVLEQSEIGEAAAYLRRSGEDWYLAVQNSANGAQEMTFDLDFLGDGDWYADIYYDNLNVAASVKRRVEQVTKESSLTAQIRSGGGYVVRLTKTPISYEPEEGKTYEINTVEDLDLIRQHPDATFNLNADLTLSGTFQPIPVLNGTLNGNGHTITGLRVSDTDASAALILQNNGIIRQMGLTDVLIDGPYTADNSWRASLCVKNYGTIEECYALGSVSGGHRNGGLVSENYNTIQNCYFIGTLESNYETGGITSWNQNGTAQVVNYYVRK
ncbi:MAG: glycoside hydrolase family 97 N-terminal domain-containing protein [Clostridiales bacterium]|nr:glycoside hydrolase family 97 N-terminal domain-containing protein [Clostridiales bacterium]